MSAWWNIAAKYSDSQGRFVSSQVSVGQQVNVSARNLLSYEDTQAALTEAITNASLLVNSSAVYAILTDSTVTVVRPAPWRFLPILSLLHCSWEEPQSTGHGRTRAPPCFAAAALHPGVEQRRHTLGPLLCSHLCRSAAVREVLCASDALNRWVCCARLPVALLLRLGTPLATQIPCARPWGTTRR